MSMIIRAHVEKCQLERCAGQWIAEAEATDLDGYLVTSKARHAYSWPEAMQQAHKLIRDIDRELLDAIYEERVQSRESAA